MKHLTETEQRLFFQFSELPLPVFAITKDGQFIFSNAIAKNLFNSDDGNLKINLIYEGLFYGYEFLLSKIENILCDKWKTLSTVSVTHNSRLFSVTFSYQAVVDPFDQLQKIVFMACKMEEQQSTRPLEDMSSTGIFELSYKGSFIYTNRKFKTLFKYDEMSMLDSRHLFSNENDYLNFRESFKESKTIHNQQVLLKRKDGSHFIGNINVLGECDASGQITTIKGSIEDITFNSILKDVPIGLYYVIKNSNHKEIILSANDQFAEIVGLTHSHECEGLEMESFHVNKKSYQDLLLKINEADFLNSTVKNEPITIKTQKGETKDIIINVKTINNGDNLSNIHGRVGAIYDVTDDIQRKFAEWSLDFASFFHSYSAISVSIRSALIDILSEEDDDMLTNGRLIISNAIKKLRISINNLANLVFKFCKLALEKEIAKKEEIDILFHYAERLHDFNDNDSIKVMASWVRQITLKIKKHIEKETDAKLLGRDIAKSLNSEINDALHHTRILTIDSNITELNDILTDIDMFKEGLLLGNDILEFKYVTSFSLVEVINSCIRSLEPFAIDHGIQVRQNFEDKKFNIKANKRFIYNAIYNIIHNAIKYSWKRSDREAWVDVRLNLKDNAIILEIENRGVPISKTEIESDNLFRMGQRGELSQDRNRPGSGIGLWYSKKIFNRYNSTIKIKSMPISYNRPDDYTKPFLTTLTITFLPFDRQ